MPTRIAAAAAGARRRDHRLLIGLTDVDIENSFDRFVPVVGAVHSQVRRRAQQFSQEIEAGTSSERDKVRPPESLAE
jgi:hypothetical protein